MSIRINRVYTRSGDSGKTALIGGTRVSKADLRVASYGEIDELNAVLGLVKEEVPETMSALRPVLEQLQQDLFSLGNMLATPTKEALDGTPEIRDEQVKNLERLCDHYNKGLDELTSFILPGGTKLAAQLHHARSVSRRAERTIVALHEQCLQSGTEGLAPALLKYINRFSDLLFILARWVLKEEGREAVLWKRDSK